MSRHAVFATSIVVAVIAAGCSSSSGGEIVESDVSAPAGPSFDDPSDPSGWLAPRDPTGSIRRDLDRLGALDDGIVGNIDKSYLIHLIP